MSKFVLFWLDGKKETVFGKSIDDAFNRAGYNAGALRALDFYGNEKDENEYAYDKEYKEWRRTDF